MQKGSLGQPHAQPHTHTHTDKEPTSSNGKMFISEIPTQIACIPHQSQSMTNNKNKYKPKIKLN